MIIDCHTHICPDKLAKVIADAAQKHLGLTYYGPLTVSGLIASMDSCGIDLSVAFNVAEKPGVVSSANAFMIKAAENKRIVGFGSIHPDFEDYKNEILRLKSAGMKGIKFNTLLQDFYLDEPRVLRVLEEMTKQGLIAYFHSGKDPGRPSLPAKVSPRSLARIPGLLPDLKVVAAHFGGLFMLDDVEEYLAGENIYIDTSWWAEEIDKLDPSRITRLIRKHGVGKVLFGSDYPASPPQKVLDWVRNLPLTEKEKAGILSENAKRLLAL